MLAPCRCMRASCHTRYQGTRNSVLSQAAQQAHACRTVQEREQDYSKARARIFGAQQSPDASMSPSHSPQIHDNAMRGMMNGSRPQNVGPMGGWGRGPPGRVDPSRKAVFRNREQDLQDPDYRRSNPYRCCLEPCPISVHCHVYTCKVTNTQVLQMGRLHRQFL